MPGPHIPHFPHPTPHPIRPHGEAGYAPSAPPPQGLAEGMMVRFRCKTGRNLKLGGDGVVTGNGANGKFGKDVSIIFIISFIFITFFIYVISLINIAQATYYPSNISP